MNGWEQRRALIRHMVLWQILTVVCGGIVYGQGTAGTALGSGEQAKARSPISIRVGPDGLPVQLDWKTGPLHGVLSGPCRLFLESPQGMVPVPALHEASPGNWVADWQAEHLQLVVQYGKEPDTNITFTVQNLGLQARKVQLDLILPVIAEADHAFFPAGSEPQVTLHSGEPEVVYGYGVKALEVEWEQLGSRPNHVTALPLGAIYSTKADWGLALVGDHDAPIVGLGFSVARSKDDTTIKVFFPDLNLNPGEAGIRRLYLASTAGDWRPALGVALALFPRAFQPKNSDIAELYGPFVCSNGTPADDEIAEWYAQGTRVVEIHGTAPFYGMYVPDREPFVPFVDDDWHFLRGPRRPHSRRLD